MKPIRNFPLEIKKNIRFILTDIDDTLTHEGRFPSIALSAMEKLKSAGIRVIPVTGRPAGWCDHIARMWPVDGLVGENGAFYFRYDCRRKKMIRRYWKTEKERMDDRAKLNRLKRKILSRIPGCRISADQAYREADLAVDYCEDVSPMDTQSVNEIVRIFEDAGAVAKISSIHVNGWFGDYDKLAMTRIFFSEVFELNGDEIRARTIYIGDSPNDCPMFAFFPHSVGVANILEFKDGLEAEPAWVTEKPGGYGFSEMVTTLLKY